MLVRVKITPGDLVILGGNGGIFECVNFEPKDLKHTLIRLDDKLKMEVFIGESKPQIVQEYDGKPVYRIMNYFTYKCYPKNKRR